MKVFVVDLHRCNGCHNCQIACKDEHVGNDWSPYAKPQPDTGHFWCKVNQKTSGQIPKVRLEYTPLLCNHCEKCVLEEKFPDIVYTREDGLVIIDPEKSKGHKEFVEMCPNDSVFWNEQLQIPQKCTGCAHLVDADEKPHCVDLCPTQALRFGDIEEFENELQEATFIGSSELNPHVYYLNVPGLFISGDVWSFEDDEVIIGAQVTLESSDGSILKQQTDGFGDFWFEHLSAGSYVLHVCADGYKSVSKNIELSDSLNVGDFPLEKI